MSTCFSYKTDFQGNPFISILFCVIQIALQGLGPLILYAYVKGRRSG